MDVSNITFVARGIAIGGLLAYAEPEELKKFGLVMNVAWELALDERGVRKPEDVLTNGVVVRNGWLDDNDDPDGQAGEIERAVANVKQTRAIGTNCLVTCAAGRNRSALVVAEYLIQSGEKPQVVVAQIQRLRHKALTNEAFVRWLCRKRS